MANFFSFGLFLWWKGEGMVAIVQYSLFVLFIWIKFYILVLLSFPGLSNWWDTSPMNWLANLSMCTTMLWMANSLTRATKTVSCSSDSWLGWHEVKEKGSNDLIFSKKRNAFSNLWDIRMNLYHSDISLLFALIQRILYSSLCTFKAVEYNFKLFS